MGYCPWGRKESDMSEHTHAGIDHWSLEKLKFLAQAWADNKWLRWNWESAYSDFQVHAPDLYIHFFSSWNSVSFSLSTWDMLTHHSLGAFIRGEVGGWICSEGLHEPRRQTARNSMGNCAFPLASPSRGTWWHSKKGTWFSRARYWVCVLSLCHTLQS